MRRPNNGERRDPPRRGIPRGAEAGQGPRPTPDAATVVKEREDRIRYLQRCLRETLEAAGSMDRATKSLAAPRIERPGLQ